MHAYRVLIHHRVIYTHSVELLCCFIFLREGLSLMGCFIIFFFNTEFFMDKHFRYE